jgi:hypothetical protein
LNDRDKAKNRENIAAVEYGRRKGNKLSLKTCYDKKKIKKKKQRKFL